MKIFTDATGRSWTLTVTVDALKRVRGLAGVDLVEAVTGDLWARLIEDPVLLCDAVFALAKPEADERNVSDADFGRAMVGDALGAALLALQEELVGFFPSHQRVRLVAQMLEATEAMQGKVKEAAQRLRATPASGPQGSGDSSGASPASSGATPET